MSASAGDAAAMTTWDDVHAATPELAELVRARIEEHGLAYLATLRADGSPRISGIEPLFADGELWLGMMDGSRKAADLLRDPRLELHGATVDKAVTAGDVRVSGRAVEVDETAQATFRRRFAEHNGQEPPPGPFHLFRVDVTRLACTRPGPGPGGEVDHLDIDTWTVDRGVSHVDRY
jgi:hypothetical protein